MKLKTTFVRYVSLKEKKKSSIRKGGSISAFLGPYAICFLVFNIFPLILGLIMAFSGFDGKTMMPSSFVGWKNFQAVFTNPVLSRDFWSSVWTTIRFCLIIVPLSIVIPIFLAILVNVKPFGYKFFRACIYLPTIFPITATGLIILRMFDYQYGFINPFFNINVDWFGEVVTCWIIVGVFCLWAGVGGNFLIIDAGLENVDKSLYEASSVDGCNFWGKFIHVTLPGIKNQLFLCLFSTFIGYMNLYGQLYILASNTPDQDAMKSAVYRIQDLLTGSSKSYGFAAAMGICLGVIIIFISIIQLLCSKEKKGGGKREKEFTNWKKSK